MGWCNIAKSKWQYLTVINFNLKNMQKSIILFLLISWMGTIIVAGCTSTTSNTATIAQPTQISTPVESVATPIITTPIPFDENSIIGIWDYIINPNTDYTRLTITTPAEIHDKFCSVNICDEGEINLTYVPTGNIYVV